jgi:hypothetical protein
VEECGLCPAFASFSLAFALKLRKKYGKISVRVGKPSASLRKTSVRVKTSVRISQHFAQFFQEFQAKVVVKTKTHISGSIIFSPKIAPFMR